MTTLNDSSAPQSAATTRFLEEAAELLGPRGFTVDPDLLEPWLTDWRGRYTGKALALASPATTQEVAALVGALTLGAKFARPGGV